MKLKDLSKIQKTNKKITKKIKNENDHEEVAIDTGYLYILEEKLKKNEKLYKIAKKILGTIPIVQFSTEIDIGEEVFESNDEEEDDESEREDEGEEEAVELSIEELTNEQENDDDEDNL